MWPCRKPLGKPFSENSNPRLVSIPWPSVWPLLVPAIFICENITYHLPLISFRTTPWTPWDLFWGTNRCGGSACCSWGGWGNTLCVYIFPLCRTCVQEEQAKPMLHRTHYCRHSDVDRMLRVLGAPPSCSKPWKKVTTCSKYMKYGIFPKINVGRVSLPITTTRGWS